jgi:hypothetical protein
MKTKLFTLSVLAVFIVAVMAVSVSAATLSEWDLTANGSAKNVNSDVSAGTFTNSADVTNFVFGANGAQGENWSLTSSPNTSKYLEVTISPKSGNDLTITDLSFDYGASIVGPVSLQLQYSTQSNFASPSTIVTKTDVSSTQKSSASSGLSINVNEGETLTLRWFGYGFSADTNELRVKNLKIDGTATSTTESFCSNGEQNVNDLRLKVKIDNKGNGDDDDWIPLDTIEVEVELENDKNLDGDGDLSDVIFELGLFKKGSTSNIIDDMMWISKDDEEVEVGDIDEDEKDSHIFEFRVDPREVDDSSYILKAKAYPDRDESDTCISQSADFNDFGSSEFFADIKVSKENEKEKMVVVDEESYPTVINAFCGEQVSLNADVYNIGDKNFDDQIKVTLTNTELSINEEVVVSGDFDEGDKTDVAFSFKIPKDATEKTHKLTMLTYYDYDKDDDQYDEVSEDKFEALVKVEGNCESSSSSSGTGKSSVNARLESGGKAGEDLVVRATITNTGDATTDYIVSAAGYNSWASSANVNLPSFTLNAGDSRDVLVTLKVKDDASGTNQFDIEVIAGNQLSSRQPVSVSIEGSSSGFLTGGITGALGGSSYLWLLGILNVLLVVVIVVVAVRVLSK